MRRRREKVEISGDEEQIVSFRLGKEIFAVKVSQVREIGKAQDIAKVPKTPEFIEGVMNLRGQITTVINLKKRLNISDGGGLSSSSRIIVAEIGDHPIGIMVDAVEDVMQIPRQSIAPPPKTLVASVDALYLVGICKVSNKLIMLLDLDSMLSVEDIKEHTGLGRTKPTCS